MLPEYVYLPVRYKRLQSIQDAASLACPAGGNGLDIEIDSTLVHLFAEEVLQSFLVRYVLWRHYMRLPFGSEGDSLVDELVWQAPVLPCFEDKHAASLSVKPAHRDSALVSAAVLPCRRVNSHRDVEVR